MPGGDADKTSVVEPGTASIAALDKSTIQDVLDVEKLRIDRDNRRTGFLEKSLELADAQDQRQFEFASKTRDDQLELEQERLKFLRTLVWILVGLVSLAVASLLSLFVFGNEVHRAAVAQVASPLLIGLAGWGVISTLTRAVKALTNR